MERSVGDSKSQHTVKRMNDAMPSKINKERQFCTLRDGRKIAYILQGSPAAPDTSSLPYVFMFPGMCCTADDVIFRRSPPEKYVYVCVDRPGYGDSSCPSVAEYSYKQFAKDMQELANHLSTTEFYVAGHSSGGPCALGCAAHLGQQLVKGVALISSDAEYAKDGAPTEGPLVICCLKYLLPCYFYTLSCGGMCWKSMKKRLPGHEIDYRLERELYDFCVETIEQPTLVVFGQNDAWGKTRAKFLKEEIGQRAELMEIPGADHVTIIKQVHVDAIISRLLAMTAQMEDSTADE